MTQETDKPEGASPFKVLSRKEVYRNRWISVREDRVLRQGGQEGIFGVVTRKVGSSVLPITEDLQTFLTSAYRYGVGRMSLEVAGGVIDDGEEPLSAAKRELDEELGLQAHEWLDAGRIDPFTTVISSPNFMFVALGLKATSQHLEPGEVLSVVKLPFTQALHRVMTGQITHGASCVLILKAQTLLKARGLLS